MAFWVLSWFSIGLSVYVKVNDNQTLIHTHTHPSPHLINRILAVTCNSSPTVVIQFLLFSISLSFSFCLYCYFLYFSKWINETKYKKNGGLPRRPGTSDARNDYWHWDVFLPYYFRYVISNIPTDARVLCHSVEQCVRHYNAGYKR